MIRFFCYMSYRIVSSVITVINHNACCYYSTIGNNSKFYRTAVISNAQKDKSSIIVGNNSHIRGELLVFGHGGKVAIGDYCYIGESTRIWSASNISIGNRVLISHNVNIHDNNSHPIDDQLRHEQFKKIIGTGHPKEKLDLNEKPIIIKDDVWIGYNVSILKGVTIGESSIIGSDSVVTKDIPPHCIAIGNPAVIVRKK